MTKILNEKEKNKIGTNEFGWKDSKRDTWMQKWEEKSELDVMYNCNLGLDYWNNMFSFHLGKINSKWRVID